MSIFMPIVSAGASPLEMKVQEGWIEKQLPENINAHDGNPRIIIPNGAMLITIISIGSDMSELILEDHHRPMSRWGKPLLTEDLKMFTDKITKNIKKDETTAIPTFEQYRNNLLILERLKQLKEIASLTPQ